MRKYIFIALLAITAHLSPAQDRSKEERMIDSLQQVINRLKIEQAEREIRELMGQREKQNEDPAVLPQPSLMDKPGGTVPVITAPEPEKHSVRFTEEQLKKFELRAMDMLQDLMFQINIIAYKKNTNDKKNAAITASMNLFSSEGNTVEVRSLKNPASKPLYRKIREYLNLLKSLSYSDVKFSAFEIEIAEELTLGKDNKYYGELSFCQKFEGDQQVQVQERFKPVRVEDITCKRIQVIVQKDEGFDGEIWRVFFGDISVDHYDM